MDCNILFSFTVGQRCNRFVVSGRKGEDGHFTVGQCCNTDLLGVGEKERMDILLLDSDVIQICWEWEKGKGWTFYCWTVI